MKVIFMGTPEFAAVSLKALIAKHSVLAVVCQPDKPNKRGNKTVMGAVKSLAIDSGIEVIQPDSVKEPEFINKISGFKPDVIVVAAYGKILPVEILKIPRFGCINVHASLLPKLRGAAPIQRAIIDGAAETGITIMYMDVGLDTGDMLRKRHVVIEPADTYGDLLEKLSLVGAEELLAALNDILSDTVTRTIQNGAEATYAPIIDKGTGCIDWKKSGTDIVNLIRGLNPAPGAYCDFADKKLKIWRAEIYGNADAGADFGEIIDVLPKKGIVVNASNTAVLITEVQSVGGKKMAAAEFIRGRKVEVGMMMK